MNLRLKAFLQNAIIMIALLQPKGMKINLRSFCVYEGNFPWDVSQYKRITELIRLDRTSEIIESNV